MATGIPKNGWNSGELSNVNGNKNGYNPAVLKYDGKKDSKEILQTPPSKCHVIWPRKSHIPEKQLNRLYYGDNLPILSSLLSDSDIAGKVRLIYIDPPFGTKGVFQSRNQADAYADILSGGDYLEFLRERIILLQELLSKDGSIYVHLDENMAFFVKVLMDEIFGPKNFRNWITRRKCNRKNYTRKTYGNVADYILFYTKSDDYVWNRAVEPWTDEAMKREYQYFEEDTGRRYKKVPIHAPGVRRGETGKPWRGMNPPPGKHWQYMPAKLDEMDKRGEIYWSPTGNPRRKIYFDQSEGLPIQDVWMNFLDAHNQNIGVTGYPTEKNPGLLRRIVSASSNVGDIVFDCFCGSGTTLAAAEELGRKWVGIDNSVEAISTTLRRFLIGTEPMGDFVSMRSKKLRNTANQLGNLNLFNDQTANIAEPELSSHEPIIDFDLLSCEPESRATKDLLLSWSNELSRRGLIRQSDNEAAG